MDVELAEVRDFLSQNEPFDALPPAVLDDLPKRLVAKYYRRGTAVVSLGERNRYLYVLRSGAVDIVDAQGALVERTDPGGSFGVSSVLSGDASLYTLRAIEDSLCLLMPSEVFHSLMGTHPAFADFFLRRQAGRLRHAVEAVHHEESGSAILRTRASDIVKRAPITIEPTRTIREAAQLMTERRVSALLVTEPVAGASEGRLVGILTDRDLRSKVIAGALPIDDPVSTVMTPDPVTIAPDKLAFEVLVLMARRGWHHLPVVENGRLVGMVTSGDLMRLEQANPSYLVGEVEKQTTLEGLVACSHRIPRVVSHAVAQDATAEDVSRVVTAIIDALTRKLIEFAEADLGAAPVPYCWVALGSQGRLESGLQSDQDNAIIIDDRATDEQVAWFAGLASRVVDGLEACGFERCPGDMMASNPQWRVRRATWGSYFAKWMNAPEPDALLNAQTFFDMRPVHGEVRLFETLQGAVVARAPQATRFQAYLAKQAQRFEPPIGFFRDFVLADSGEHANTLDIKAGGIAPIVQIARLLTLSKGGSELNTHGRLKSAAVAGALSEEKAADLADAFEFINYVRLRHQVRQLKDGESPDNHVPPATLSSFERRHLREAFTIIRSMQKALAFVHRTDVTS